MSNPLREICIWTRPTGDSRALCSLSQAALENGIHGLILGVPVPRSAWRPLLAAGSVRSEGSRRTWARTSAPGRGGSGTRGTGGAERRGAQMMAPAAAARGPEPFCVLPGSEADGGSFSGRAAVSSGRGWLRHCAEARGVGSRARARCAIVIPSRAR